MINSGHSEARRGQVRTSWGSVVVRMRRSRGQAKGRASRVVGRHDNQKPFRSGLRLRAGHGKRRSAGG